MPAAVPPRRLAPRADAIAALFVDAYDRDRPRLLVPRPETHLVVRFGGPAADGLDVHAIGPRRNAHRKVLRSDLRTVTARLRLGASERVLGVPAADLAGRTVALADLWGSAATRELLDALAHAGPTADAAAVLDRAIAERPTRGGARRLGTGTAFDALDAAARLARAPVGTVADDLGVSERHLRRVFHAAVGVSPKAYAQLSRFHRALRAARVAAGARARPAWADIAVAAGYYDQAHLIADFRAIAGVTPGALLDELGA